MSVAYDSRTDAILTALLESTDDMICAFDIETWSVLTFSAPAARHFAVKFGKTIQLGTRLEDMFDADSVATWQRLMLRAVNEGPYSMEHRGLVEGQIFWMSFNRLVSQGRCFGISILARDITAFGRAVRGMANAEERFATLFRASPCPVLLTTRDQGRVLDANESVTRLLGWERPQLLERSTTALGIWVDAAERDRMLEALSPGGRISGFEARLHHRDGRVLNCLVGCEAVIIEGRPCLLTSITDITALRAAEQALRESEVRYRALIETAPEAIVVVDMDSGTYVDTNQNASRLSGLDKMRLLGTTPMALSPATQPAGSSSEDIIKDRLARAAAGAPQVLEWVHIRPDGKPLYCEVRLTSLPDSKRRLVRASIIDISERKRLEEEASVLRAHLEHAQRMDSLGTLAGGIAHDFNNVLGAILGSAETALLRTQEASVRPLLENIERGVSRAMDLVRQILAFSRQAPHDKKPVQVARITSEAMSLVRAALPATIDIKQHYDSSASVLADPTQIHQVVMNLCTNAGLAMRDAGGTLELLVTEREPDAKVLAQHPWLEPGPHVCVTVRDTGCGISAEVLPRIFEPFFTTRPQGEGIGLGLSVAYGIVKDAAGAVTVTSQPGVGSTFQVFLPIYVADATQAAPKDATKNTTKNTTKDATRDTTKDAGVDATAKLDASTGPRVLFVDDETALVTLTGGALTHLGFEVTALASPAEAIREFERRPRDFDVVVTDMSMPSITGETLGRSIKRIRPDIPMILMSGDRTNLAREHARSAGFDLCLDKPFRPTELARAIRTVCPGSAVKTSDN